jgi:hypothetical protein
MVALAGKSQNIFALWKNVCKPSFNFLWIHTLKNREKIGLKYFFISLTLIYILFDKEYLRRLISFLKISFCHFLDAKILDPVKVINSII